MIGVGAVGTKVTAIACNKVNTEKLFIDLDIRDDPSVSSAELFRCKLTNPFGNQTNFSL